MSVRPATLEDVTDLVELGARLHATSTYAKYSYARHKVDTLLSALIKGAGVAYVSTVDGRIVGGIAGGVTEHWFGHDVHGFDYSFFIEPEFRNGTTALKLLLALEAWCRLKGATEMRIGITTGIAVHSTTEFYQWAGYTTNGVLFTKELHHGN